MGDLMCIKNLDKRCQIDSIVNGYRFYKDSVEFLIDFDEIDENCFKPKIFDTNGSHSNFIVTGDLIDLFTQRISLKQHNAYRDISSISHDFCRLIARILNLRGGRILLVDHILLGGDQFIKTILSQRT